MKLKSNIGKIIDESPFKREYIRKHFNKSRNTISSWCTGKSYPSVSELFELAKILDVKVDDLYDEVIEAPKRDLSNEPINIMNFEPRTFHALIKNKIFTYKDLKSRNLNECRGIGKATMNDIEQKLKKWEQENE